MRSLRTLLLVATATFAGCSGEETGTNPEQADAFRLTATSVRFDATQGGAAPSPQFSYIAIDFVSNTTPTPYFTTSQTGAMFRHTFSEALRQIVITPALPTESGSFTGTVTVSACSNPSRSPCNHLPGSPKTINVAYTVAGMSITPSQVIFTSTDVAWTPQAVTVAVTGGSPAWSFQVGNNPWWNATPDWLWMVEPASPDPMRQTVSFNVDRRAALPRGVNSLPITFSTPPNFFTRMWVTYIVADPSVNFVAPYVVPAGGGGDVIIRGYGFSALNPATLSVQFNSIPAVSAVVVSDTEIHATYPALAAGSYPISVSSGATTIPSRAALKLVVVDPLASGVTTIQRPTTAGRPAYLMYDAERKALLFTDLDNRRILRYALSDSGSTTLDNAPGAIALSPDGTEIIRAGPGNSLIRHDPVTLTQLSSIDVSAPLGASSVTLSQIAFGSDGAAIGNAYAGGGSLYRYDMLTQQITPVISHPLVFGRRISASADGDTLVLPSVGYTFEADRRVLTYDASTGALTPRSATTSDGRPLSVSRNASRTILVSDADPRGIAVYDAHFNALGTLPDGASTFVLSPDGHFAYAYYQLEGKVRKFDLGLPTDAPSGITEVGAGSALAPANTDLSEMTISPDGGTLFLAGTTSVVIAPAP